MIYWPESYQSGGGTENLPNIRAIFWFQVPALELKLARLQNMDNLLVELRTILEPLKLADLFPRPALLEVELGCGDASFLVEYARRNPDINFIGVERLLGRCLLYTSPSPRD